MKFSLLLFVISRLIKVALVFNKDLKEMCKVKKVRYVIMTKDGSRGRRFNFNHGVFSSDTVLSEYDMAWVWKDAETGFKVLTSGDTLAMFNAVNNWELEFLGDKTLFQWFGIILNFATGAWKRK